MQKKKELKLLKYSNYVRITFKFYLLPRNFYSNRERRYLSVFGKGGKVVLVDLFVFTRSISRSQIKSLLSEQIPSQTVITMVSDSFKLSTKQISF